MIRAIYYVGARSPDLGRLIRACPQVEIVAARTPEEAARELETAQVLIVGGNDYVAPVAEAARRSPSLRWIQFTSAGLDGAQKVGPFPEGVELTNMAGLRAANLSEHAFALMLFLTRRLRRTEAGRSQRAWRRDVIVPEMISLRGRVMLIVGMGAIGQAVAKRARAFDMRVWAVSRAYRADDLVEKAFPREEALDAFREADVILICAASEPQTRGFVDQQKLAAMKRSAILINVSRGDLIDETALAEVCRAGAIAGAGLDVTRTEPLPSDSGLWDLENVVITPHIGGAGSEQLERLLDAIAENLARFVRGEPLLRRVAF